MIRYAAVVVAAVALCGFAPASAYHVETKIPLADGGWDLASFDPVTHRVYLARTDAVTVLDVATGQARQLAPASRGHAAVPVNGGREVMVTDGGTNTARFLDANTGGEVAKVAVGTGPDAALVDPATGLAVVMNARSGDITLIDPKSHTVAATVPVGGSLELGAADGHGRVFVNVEDKDELVVLDVRARQVRHVALQGCVGPTGIAFLPRSGKILSSCANGVAAVTDARTLAAGPRLPIGVGPDTVMYDAVRHRALVPCGRSGELAVFADTPQGVTAEGRVQTQVGARTGALDESTGRVYLPAADYAPPAAAGGRPSIKPGSVVMVVVAP